MQKTDNKPFPLRLGIMKPYLQKIAFKDENCKGLTGLIKKNLHSLILSDEELRDEYLKHYKKKTKEQ